MALQLRSTPFISALAAASCLFVAACGGGTDSFNTSSPAPAPAPAPPVTVKIIGMNDFHGNFEIPAVNNGGAVTVKDSANVAGTVVNTGGAAYLATLIKQLRAKNPYNILVGAGDMISASPVTSALTHDEATVDILNQIGLEVTSVGNHEFDRGKTELLRIQNGGSCYPGGVMGQDTCLIDGKYPGASYKYLAANVTDTSTGNTLLPPTYIKKFGSVSVGFVGLTLKGTPAVVTSTGIAGLSFDDEATVINKYAKSLKASGVNAVVVLIHQGGQSTASTLNDKTCPGFTGEITPIVSQLSNDVSLVVSGHTHQEYICNLKNAAGNNVLVTSTGFYGSAVTEIDMTIDPNTGKVSVDANTVPVINDTNKTLPAGYVALAKDATIDAAVQKYVTLSGTLKNTVAGSITADIKRALLPNASTPSRDETAEGPMGDVMADVYLSGGPAADIAFINPGGVRADLIFKGTGDVTIGDLLTVAPFGNTLATVDMTGAQILQMLENQWEKANCDAKQGANGCGRMLQPSANFSYTWDASKPSGAAAGQGSRVVSGSVKIGGVSMDMTKTYRVTLNSFMAPGPGDNFTAVTSGKNVANSFVKDIDAFVTYMKAHPKLAPPTARVTRLN